MYDVVSRKPVKHICTGENHCDTLEAPGFLRSVYCKKEYGRIKNRTMISVFMLKMMRINDECQPVMRDGYGFNEGEMCFILS